MSVSLIELFGTNYSEGDVWGIINEALEEAYKNEVLDTEMYDNVIGRGNEFADKADWLYSKFLGWVHEAQKRETVEEEKFMISVDGMDNDICHQSSVSEAIRVAVENGAKKIVVRRNE